MYVCSRMPNAHCFQKRNKRAHVRHVLRHKSEARAAALVVDADAGVEHFSGVESPIVPRRQCEHNTAQKAR
jgi:hypothetical protein